MAQSKKNRAYAAIFNYFNRGTRRIDIAGLKRLLAPIYSQNSAVDAPSTKTIYRIIEDMNIGMGITITYDSSTKSYSCDLQTNNVIQTRMLHQISTIEFNEMLLPDLKTGINYIEFDNNAVINGEQYLALIYEALKLQRWIKISYQTFGSDTVKTHKVAPLLLKEHDSRWYLLAVIKGDKKKVGIKSKDAAILFGLERIQDISITDTKIAKNIYQTLPAYPALKKEAKLLPRDLFTDIIGVDFSRAGTVPGLTLWVSKALAPYIKTKPLHHSQEVINDNSEGMQIKIFVRHNQELKKLLLSFGASVRVLEPLSLVKDMKAELGKALEQY